MIAENHKFIVLDINKLKEEEQFLSKKFDYKLTNYTKNLLGFYNKVKTNTGPTKEERLPPQ